MINPGYYLKSAGMENLPNLGGQELILHEICALLYGYADVWVPFPEACITLTETLQTQGHAVVSYAGQKIDAVYFGSPTIVNGRVLFEGENSYGITDKASERAAVRSIIKAAKAGGVKRIVSGLGSGDISVGERQQDMGRHSRIVTKKVFDTFTDWVIVRDL